MIIELTLEEDEAPAADNVISFAAHAYRMRRDAYMTGYYAEFAMRFNDQRCDVINIADRRR